MRLEDQLTNLELSKRLKELGVKQASIFYWEDRPEGPRLFPSSSDEVHMYSTYAAFTASELGEMLPFGVDSGRTDFEAPNHPKGFYCQWKSNATLKNAEVEHIIFADTEADARCKMLIYLIEQGLIDAKKIK